MKSHQRTKAIKDGPCSNFLTIWSLGRERNFRKSSKRVLSAWHLGSTFYRNCFLVSRLQDATDRSRAKKLFIFWVLSLQFLVPQIKGCSILQGWCLTLRVSWRKREGDRRILNQPLRSGKKVRKMCMNAWSASDGMKQGNKILKGSIWWKWEEEMGDECHEVDVVLYRTCWLLSDTGKCGGPRLSMWFPLHSRLTDREMEKKRQRKMNWRDD